jgi:hypothetical protein
MPYRFHKRTALDIGLNDKATYFCFGSVEHAHQAREKQIPARRNNRGGPGCRAGLRAGLSGQLSGYMGKSDTFDRALASFPVAYADQNERDHAALKRAIREGKIEAHFEENR